MADDRRPDVEVQRLRDELTPARAGLVAAPEDFGLTFASPDELIARAGLDEVAKRRRRRTRLAAFGAGLAAAATVTTAVVLPRLDDGARPAAALPVPTATHSTTDVTYGTARDVLLAAARVAGPQTKDIRYWHVKSFQTFGHRREPRELWIGNGRPGVLRQEGATWRFPSRFPFGGRRGGNSWAEMLKLPTDTAKLRELLVAGGGPDWLDDRWKIFSDAGFLLGEAPLPPRVRSAMWRVLASVPGTRLAKATDSVGRKGWSVSLRIPVEGLMTYIVDPATGQLLEQREKRDGFKQWRITYVERGPADTAPALGRT